MSSQAARVQTSCGMHLAAPACRHAHSCRAMARALSTSICVALVHAEAYIGAQSWSTHQHAASGLEQGTGHAGTGSPLTLVMTDVEGSTELWEFDKHTTMRWVLLPVLFTAPLPKHI